MTNAVAELILRAARRHGPLVAVSDTTREATFAQTGERVARLANALLAVSGEPSRCVGVLMGNRIEYVEADLAIAVAGKVRAPVNVRLADDERRYVLANVAVETLITEMAELERVAAVTGELDALRRILVVDAVPGATLPAKAMSYEQALAAASPGAPAVPLDDEAPAVVLHTSGTTGRPKGATLPVRGRLGALLHSLAEEYSPGVGDGMLHVGSLAHGSGAKVLTYFTRGARNIVLDRFEPASFFDAVARHGATSTFLVPTMVRMLLDHPDRPAPGTAGLRNLTYGGAGIDTDTRAEALELFGPVLTQVYGSCEAPHPVLILRQDEHLSPETAGVTGREVAGVQARLVGDDGADVAGGEVGELWVRGRNVMSGYWDDPAATAEVFTGDWYHTGDAVRRSPEGWLAVVDRKRDMIISGGLNVYPAEVEAALLRHPAVAEACVFGVPDPLWGESVMAAVVPVPGAGVEAGELIEHCKALLAGYKKPKQVHLRAELPKGSTGKVLKRALRDELSR